MVCGNLLTAGAPSKEREEIEAGARGCGHKPQPEISPFTLDRESYADFFGPARMTESSSVTHPSLRAKRTTTYGDECKFGAGKRCARAWVSRPDCLREVLDTVITNALIVDAVAGIVKLMLASEWENLRHRKSGKSSHDVGRRQRDDRGTHRRDRWRKVYSTAGAIDAHIHWICPSKLTKRSHLA